MPQIIYTRDAEIESSSGYHTCNIDLAASEGSRCVLKAAGKPRCLCGWPPPPATATGALTGESSRPRSLLVLCLRASPLPILYTKTRPLLATGENPGPHTSSAAPKHRDIRRSSTTPPSPRFFYAFSTSLSIVVARRIPPRPPATDLDCCCRRQSTAARFIG